MLSPTQGQVAHALLTRPPLIRDRSPVTVRLECVMHAASVHPEPGSNSQTNCISSAVAVRFLSELFILAFFTFLELCSLWFWQIFVFALALILLCTSIFCCSIVKFQSRPFLRALVYYITLFPLCQVLFKNFFKIFLTGVWVISFASLFATALLFYHFHSLLSRVFRKFF